MRLGIGPGESPMKPLIIALLAAPGVILGDA
jgi:hypothetical protein